MFTSGDRLVITNPVNLWCRITSDLTQNFAGTSGNRCLRSRSIHKLYVLVDIDVRGLYQRIMSGKVGLAAVFTRILLLEIHDVEREGLVTARLGEGTAKRNIILFQAQIGETLTCGLSRRTAVTYRLLVGAEGMTMSFLGSYHRKFPTAPRAASGSTEHLRKIFSPAARFMDPRGVTIKCTSVSVA